MKLVLSAWIGSHNLGDEAIAAVVIDMLERTPDVEGLTILSINPAKTRQLATRASTRVVQAGFGNYVRALRQSDALLLGGGGIIQDESSVINLLFYYLESWVARHVLRKPVFWIFVGVGPIHTRLGKHLLRGMRKLTTHVLVRDNESVALLGRYGFTDAQITVGYDAVFNIPLPKVRKAQYAERYLLFCPRDWFFVSAFVPTRFALKRARRRTGSRLQVYRQHLVRLVEQTLRDQADLTIVGVAFFYSQDLNLLAYIKGQLSTEVGERFVVESRELTPAEYMQLARHAVAVVGVRLHSLILGAVAGTSLVPLTYSAKVESLTKYLGIRSVTTRLDRPDFAVEAVVRKIRKSSTSEATAKGVRLESVRARNRAAYDALITAVRESLSA